VQQLSLAAPQSLTPGPPDAQLGAPPLLDPEPEPEPLLPPLPEPELLDPELPPELPPPLDEDDASPAPASMAVEGELLQLAIVIAMARPARLATYGFRMGWIYLKTTSSAPPASQVTRRKATANRRGSPGAISSGWWFHRA